MKKRLTLIPLCLALISLMACSKQINSKTGGHEHPLVSFVVPKGNQLRYESSDQLWQVFSNLNEKQFTAYVQGEQTKATHIEMYYLGSYEMNETTPEMLYDYFVNEANADLQEIINSSLISINDHQTVYIETLQKNKTFKISQIKTSIFMPEHNTYVFLKCEHTDANENQKRCQAFLESIEYKSN